MNRHGRAGDLAWPAALHIGAVVLATVVLWVVYNPIEKHSDWLGLGAMAILTMVAQSLVVEIYGRRRISTSAIFILAGGIVFGMPGVLVLAPVAPVTAWIQNRGRLYRSLFDVGDTSLAGATSVVIYSMVSAIMPGREAVLLVVPAAVAALGYYVVHVGLMSIAMGLTEWCSPVRIWDEKFRWLPLHYLVFGLLALLIALAYDAIGIYGLISIAVPPVMLRYVMQQYIDRTESNVAKLRQANEELTRAHEEAVCTLEELRSTYNATLVALSAALDSRDAGTEGHCRQVVEYTHAIAHQLGLAEPEIASLANGALLHDVGKIGVPDPIIKKPGPLTESEWAIMRTHPQVGYKMMQHIGFLKDALPVVRYHHERFDGEGYPEGLSGEQIPLGARIFAVADAIEAMTSDRPYRAACSFEQARKEIVLCAGSQFDPRVVEALMRLELDDLAKLSGKPVPPALQRSKVAERAPRTTPLGTASAPA